MAKLKEQAFAAQRLKDAGEQCKLIETPKKANMGETKKVTKNEKSTY